MDTPEKEKALMGFFMEYAQFEPNVGVLRKAVEEYKVAFPSVEKWGVFGLCWGGKVCKCLFLSYLRPLFPVGAVI